jgi:hypothetical protein
MPDQVVDVTTVYPRGEIPIEAVNTTLKVIRTLRNLALEPEHFDASVSVLLSHAHHCIMESFVASARIAKTDGELLAVAKRLREWAAEQGGWEAPCWDDLKKVLDEIEKGDVRLWKSPLES